MAFSGLEKKPNGSPMAEINMTPLIDVMLVLLVIFIITAPLFTHAIRLDLLKVASQPVRATPQIITLSIDDSGNCSGTTRPSRSSRCSACFADAGIASARVERDARYDVIAKVMGAAQQAGLSQIGFMTRSRPVEARKGQSVHFA